MITEFYDAYLNPYINFHRPCYFAVTVTDNKGKQKKTYPYEAIMTPYDKLKSLTNAEQYLKDSMTFAKLDELRILKPINKQPVKCIKHERRYLIK